MRYDFICNKCKNEIEIIQPMADTLPRDIPCEKCKEGKLNQDFKSKVKSLTVNTPESFKAFSSYVPRNYNDGSSGLEGRY